MMNDNALERIASALERIATALEADKEKRGLPILGTIGPQIKPKEGKPRRPKR
jgi:hypothetical protein